MEQIPIQAIRSAKEKFPVIRLDVRETVSVTLENFFAFADILEVEEDTAQEILDEFIDEEEDLIIEE